MISFVFKNRSIEWILVWGDWWFSMVLVFLGDVLFCGDVGGLNCVLSGVMGGWMVIFWD